jgi:class 3 adenylate cyclase
VGQDHASKAVKAGRELLRVTGQAVPDGPWVLVGVGVNPVKACIGAVGSSDQVSDITALGDSVNVAARLASMAGTGELFFSEDSRNMAGISKSGLEERNLELQGKCEPMPVWVMRLNYVFKNIGDFNIYQLMPNFIYRVGQNP